LTGADQTPVRFARIVKIVRLALVDLRCVRTLIGRDERDEPAGLHTERGLHAWTNLAPCFCRR
jgi:hypothetical protein